MHRRYLSTHRGIDSHRRHCFRTRVCHFHSAQANRITLALFSFRIPSTLILQITRNPSTANRDSTDPGPRCTTEIAPSITPLNNGVLRRSWIRSSLSRPSSSPWYRPARTGEVAEPARSKSNPNVYSGYPTGSPLLQCGEIESPQQQ